MNNRLLRSRYRKELWKQSRKIIRQLMKVLPFASIHILGSFLTKKRRPADVDFIVLIKVKDSNDSEWSVDVVFAPDNAHGQSVLDDARKWMKQKYGNRFEAIELTE